MRVCTEPGCGLRFPVQDQSELGSQCPTCGKQTRFADEVFETHEVDRSSAPAGPPLYVLLDNVRSLANVGSIVRTCDATGVAGIYLTGISPALDHPKMAKTALGAERHVPWERHANAVDLVDELKARGHRLWAIEAGPGSTRLDLGLEAARESARPIVLIFGHEVSGVDPRVLARCERLLHLPMLGTKGSLNVSVAVGVALYWLRWESTLRGAWASTHVDR